MGQGLFLAVFAAEAAAVIGTLPLQRVSFYAFGAFIAAAFLALGLIASLFHVERARRDVIVPAVCAGAVFAYGLMHHLVYPGTVWIGALATVLCVPLFVAPAIASGFTAAAAFAPFAAPALAVLYAWSAVALTLIALCIRLAARHVKGTLLLLAFVIPVALLAVAAESGERALGVAAFAVQYIGLVAERWYFAHMTNARAGAGAARL